MARKPDVVLRTVIPKRAASWPRSSASASSRTRCGAIGHRNLIRLLSVGIDRVEMTEELRAAIGIFFLSVSPSHPTTPGFTASEYVLHRCSYLVQWPVPVSFRADLR